LINVNPQVQNIVTGGLLLASVTVPNGPQLWRRARTALRRNPLDRGRGRDNVI
jgi:hypothetical protein